MSCGIWTSDWYPPRAVLTSEKAQLGTAAGVVKFQTLRRFHAENPNQNKSNKILQFQIPKGTTYSVGACVSCIVNKYLYEWINWWFECFSKITANKSYVKICTINLSKKWHTIGSYLRIMGIIKNLPRQMKCKAAYNNYATYMCICLYMYKIYVYKIWINFSPWSMNSSIVSLCFSSLKIFIGT